MIKIITGSSVAISKSNYAVMLSHTYIHQVTYFMAVFVGSTKTAGLCMAKAMGCRIEGGGSVVPEEIYAVGVNRPDCKRQPAAASTRATGAHSFGSWQFACLCGSSCIVVKDDE